MCKTCGCSDDAEPTLTVADGAKAVPLMHHHHDHDHPHQHAHSDGHHHHHGDGHGHSHEGVGAVVHLERELLARNDRLAERNRGWLAARKVLAVNLMSSPGSGKTMLLERTARELGRELALHVIEGDQATDRDARRVRAAGCKAVQINTGVGCHLDAAMVARGFEALDPPAGSVLFIENVGNLVCPALFDLGEQAKVVICSVTEGEDKPLKYPHMFRTGTLLLLNKIDLLPYVEFDIGRFTEYVREVNPGLTVLPVSATRGDGMDEWYGWLRDSLASRAASAAG